LAIGSGTLLGKSRKRSKVPEEHEEKRERRKKGEQSPRTQSKLFQTPTYNKMRTPAKTIIDVRGGDAVV
jgi:hypothetical protein